MFAMWLAAMPAAFAQRPPAVVPARADTVIEHLPRGYAKLTPSVNPATPVAAAITAQQLLSIAARNGDARLAARADRLLSMRSANERNPEVLRARAYSAQHRHDFSGSVALLDILIRQEPRDANARLARAEINLVRGRLDLTRIDCAALALGIDAGSGILCTASLSLRSGDYPTAATLIEHWLAQASANDALRRYALVMRGETAARAGDHKAGAWFQRALALDTGDVRTLSAYARYLRGAGRDSEVEPLLSGSTDHDGLQLQRALAARRVGASNADALAEAQARRYATAHAVGDEPELRDEAEFLLSLRGQPQAALALAQRNFRTQRDHEDVGLLRRTAIAAGRPEALQPLQAWAASQQLSLPPIGRAAR